jgi:hypothetical protein
MLIRAKRAPPDTLAVVYHIPMGERGKTIPPDNSLLCEDCGYVLDGLDVMGRCPECGRLIEESLPYHRQMPAWELPYGHPAAVDTGFLRTTVEVLVRPKWYFRHLRISSSVTQSRYFAIIHWFLSAVLFGLAAQGHLTWPELEREIDWIRRLSIFGMTIPTAIAVMAMLHLIVSRLTTWEARFRGLRMPIRVVSRAMYYHSAHYLTVSAVTAVYVLWVTYLLNSPWNRSLGPQYLYGLSVLAVASSVYLFWTYWIAMRSLLYANRPSAGNRRIA